MSGHNKVRRADGVPAERGASRRNSRAAILTVTRTLLRDCSYSELSMETVAQAAGLTRRTVYNQFVSKDDLYRASREVLLTELAAMVDPIIPADSNPTTALTRFAHRTVAALTDQRHLELLISVVRDGANAPWLTEAYYRRIKEPILAAVEIFLHRQVTTGRLHIRDVPQTAMQFLSTLDALAVSPKIFRTPDRLTTPLKDEQIDALVAAFIEQHSSDHKRWIGLKAATPASNPPVPITAG